MKIELLLYNQWLFSFVLVLLIKKTMIMTYEGVAAMDATNVLNIIFHDRI